MALAVWESAAGVAMRRQAATPRARARLQAHWVLADSSVSVAWQRQLPDVCLSPYLPCPTTTGNYILESPLGHIPEIVGVQLLPVDDLEGGCWHRPRPRE